MEEFKLPSILEKIAVLLQKTHQLRSDGYRVDQELRRLDWLNSKAEKLLDDNDGAARDSKEDV